MKFALVRRGYSATGGAEAYLKRFAAALAASGHEPVLVTDAAWPAGAWPFAQKAVGGGKSPLRFAERVEAAAKGCDLTFSLERVPRCDVYRAGDGVHAAWLARRARYEPRWKSWWRGFSRKHADLCVLERTMFRAENTSLVIANSTMVKDEIIAHFGYPAERIAVVYNGVPTTAEVPRREGEYTLLFAGSGWERKGLRFAVEAVQRARGAQLLVAGHGRPFAAERVRFLGPVREMAQCFAQADAFILPTIYDPFSNACLEALAHGLPVITTRANGFAEILAPEEGSVVAEAGDIAALTAAVEHWSDSARRLVVRPQLVAKGACYSVEENLRATLAALSSHAVSGFA